MTLTLRYAARSDRGLIRDGNEDAVYAGPRLLAVADGMGGHAAGEVASAVAIANLAPLDEDAPGADLLEALRGATFGANEQLRDMVAADGELAGMGTTLTAVLSAGSRLGLVHVGDSRAYLLRDGALTQITRDHTLVQALVDEGRLSPEEAGSHPQRSLVTRALTGMAGLELDLSVREARAGDRYLLCTDGLSGVVSEETMVQALSLPGPQEAVDQLVELALRGGGPDNITCIVADVVDTGQGGTGEPVVAGAAADGAAESAPPSEDTAAGRAALMRRRSGPPAAPRAPAAPPSTGRSGHGRRNAIATAVVAVVVLALAASLGWAYVRTQYYVGARAGQVAVFRGVSGSLAGIPLSTVYSRSDVRTDALPAFEQRRVSEGISATSAGDADRIVRQLQAEVAACPDAPTSVSPSPTAPTPAAPNPAEPPLLAPNPEPTAGSPCSAVQK
ncbi:MAG: hypothetical protein NVSMB13_22020 [Mycobacteriales bacterium]